ncbi:hypothetical protein [Corynebacterium phocae]|uniref:hypothetical protein n=1 Tax=Corynebacterium phocae TaxID=161895 RepID=UPI00123C251C|nr:hypothetical protein [Corynebacterium phocae]KAA8721705.1 hypothetical protein F4V58_10710 [Corynebacterium phocae]
MAAITGYRTLYPAIIPPGAKHINGVLSFTHPDLKTLVVAGAVMSSFPCDFVLRVAGAANIFGSTLESLPMVFDAQISDMLVERYLRLCALTEAYAELWEACMGTPWTPAVPVRIALERQKVQTEIDALVGLALGLDVEDLITIYRSQFPVMRRYDGEVLYDQNGRVVPKEIVKAYEGNSAETDLDWTHPQSGVNYRFEPPFEPFDREAAIQEAHAEMSQIVEQ